MAGEDKTFSFGVRVNVDTNARREASSIQELRAQVEQSQAAVRAYSAANKALRGQSEEATAARKKFKAAIDAEKDSISRNVLALDRMGASMKKLEPATAGLNQSTKTFREALKAGGDESRRFGAAMRVLDSILTGAEGSFVGAGVALGILTALAGVGAVAAFAALSYQVSKFTIENGNLLRTYQLNREAILDNAIDSIHYGHQIDVTTRKVALSREELEKMAVEQSRAFKYTRISGQGMVDAFNAVAVATSGAGKEAGNQIQGILERGKNLGRLRLSWGGIFGVDELRGTGIQTKQVAQQLATDLGVSVRQAEVMLYTGRVKLDDGAKAIREVVEKRFGEINTKRMLDLNVIAIKFKDTLLSLTRDVDMEKILRPIDELAKMFSDSTVSGEALRGLVTEIGHQLGMGFKTATPILQDFFEKGLLLGQEFQIKVLEIEIAFKSFRKEIYGAAEGLDKFLNIANHLNPATAPLAIAGDIAALKNQKALDEAKQRQADDLAKRRASEVDSPGHFVRPSPQAPTHEDGRKQGTTWSKGFKRGFDDDMKIHSPSKEMEERGEHLAEGAMIGWDKKATFNVDPAPGVAKTGPVNIGGGNRGDTKIDANVQLSLHFPEVKDARGVREALTGLQTRVDVQKVFEDLLRGAAVAPPGTTGAT